MSPELPILNLRTPAAEATRIFWVASVLLRVTRALPIRPPFKSIPPVAYAWNLAEAVADPPITRSVMVLTGERTPEARFQWLALAVPEQAVQERTPEPSVVRH